MTTYSLRLATEATRDLVVDALRAEADKRTRVAQGAAQHVASDRRSGKDVRSASVRVTALLAEAGELADLADELAAHVGTLPVISPDPPALMTAEELATNLGVPLAEVLPDPDSDDGLSEAAHRAAELAGLEDAFVDPDGEDVETGATAEDEPDVAVEVLT